MLQALSDWLRGELSPSAQFWSAVAPALAVLLYLAFGMAAFAVRNKRGEPFRDPAVEELGGSPLLRPWFRHFVAWTLRPALGVLLRLNIPAYALTTLAVLIAIGSGAALAAGRLALGGWLFVVAGIASFLDRRLALEAGDVSGPNPLLRAVLDRYAETVVLIGLAWYYRGSWVLVAVLVALVGTMLVPYVRARAQPLEIRHVGMVQHAERVAILGVCLGLSPAVEVAFEREQGPAHQLAVIGVVLLAATTHISTVQRLLYARRVAAEGPRRKRRLGRGSLFRHSVSSVVATGSDFALMSVLVSLAGASPPVATFIGCALGGLVNFGINRIWAFSSDAPAWRSAGRYGVVTTSSALLNAGLVAVLLMLPGLAYQVAWLFVRGAVFLTWNYPLNRDYVFPEGEPVADQR